MKKILVILVVVIGFGLSANAQNVVIQTNEAGKSEKKDECAYRISGICTTEDIGGVEVSAGSWVGNNRRLKFVNYNDFSVTVIFEYVSLDTKRTGTIVLKAEEEKETQDNYYYPSDFKLISRKLGR